MKIGSNKKAHFFLGHPNIEPVGQLLTVNLSYHILGVVETGLGHTVYDTLFNIPGYSIIRQDKNTGGGGVALYVRKTLKIKILATSDTKRPGKSETHEYLACRVWQEDEPPILVFLIYRAFIILLFPPKNTPQKLQAKQFSLIEDLRKLC